MREVSNERTGTIEPALYSFAPCALCAEENAPPLDFGAGPFANECETKNAKLRSSTT